MTKTKYKGGDLVLGQKSDQLFLVLQTQEDEHVYNGYMQYRVLNHKTGRIYWVGASLFEGLTKFGA